MNKARISAAFVFALALTFSVTGLAHAGTTPLTGWLWSSTIGWISLNSNNPEIVSYGGSPYAVNFSTSTGSTMATLSGDAWSPNIGWVRFSPSDTVGCPTNDSYGTSHSIAGCAAAIDLTTGKVTGWAKAPAGTPVGSSGWDGWIQLSGTNHVSPDSSGPNNTSAHGVTFNPSTYKISGFAWSGAQEGATSIDDGIIGWLQFYCPTPTSCVSAGNPSTPATTSTTTIPNGGTSNFSVSGTGITINNTGVSVPVTVNAPVTITNTAGTATELIVMSIDASSLPAGVTVGTPTQNSCTLAPNASCVINYPVTAQPSVAATVSHFIANGTYGSLTHGAQIPVTITGGTVVVVPNNSINLWGGSLNTPNAHRLTIPPNRSLPLFWTAKNFGYCAAHATPIVSDTAGWRNMATTTTITSTGPTLTVNRTVQDQIVLTTMGSYSFWLTCSPVDNSGIRTGAPDQNSNVVTVLVTNAAVTEF